MAVGHFLAGIGALVWDAEREAFLLLKRAPDKDFAPNRWECVTGRVDQGEGFEDALHREVREELGPVGPVRPLFMIGTTHFYRGDSRSENELVGVVYGATIQNPAAIAISAEHSEYRWLALEEVRALLSEQEPGEYWLRRVVERATLLLAKMPADLLAVHSAQGFELD
jgi:8-oxo-dGTP diphosphatase